LFVRQIAKLAEKPRSLARISIQIGEHSLPRSAGIALRSTFHNLQWRALICAASGMWRFDARV
jgi:hypothetical protein